MLSAKHGMCEQLHSVHVHVHVHVCVHNVHAHAHAHVVQWNL